MTLGHSSRTACGVVILVLLCGCTSLPGNESQLLNKLIIRNQTGELVTDVVLSVTETHQVVKFNGILPGRDATMGFRAIRDQRNHATLTWRQFEQTYTREINAYVSHDLDPAQPASVVLVIGGNSKLRSWIESNSSRR